MATVNKDTGAAPTSPENPEIPCVIRIPPRAFLRSMWAIAWNTFRHPWTDTMIDLSTGEVVPPKDAEETAGVGDHG